VVQGWFSGSVSSLVVLFCEPVYMGERITVRWWWWECFIMPIVMKSSMFCCSIGKLLFFPFLTTKQAYTKWLLTVLKRIMMVRDTTPLWWAMLECDPEPLQFKWFRAATLLYNAFIQSNCSNVGKVYKLMQLSSRCDVCWSFHILSAMNGLKQS